MHFAYSYNNYVIHILYHIKKHMTNLFTFFLIFIQIAMQSAAKGLAAANSAKLAFTAYLLKLSENLR